MRPEETPGVEGRPADAARRALRAARERERAAGEGRDGEPPTGEADLTVPEGKTAGTARPGDVARAALRRANSSRRSAAGTASPPEPAEGAPPVARAVPRAVDTPPPSAAPATRPGDAAREALRAARAEAERKQGEEQERGQGPERGQGEEQERGQERERGQGEERGRERNKETAETREPQRLRAASELTDGHGHGPSRIARLSAARRRRDVRARGTGDRAREVRELLAGAFGLPASSAPQGRTASAARTPRGGREETSPHRRHGVADPVVDPVPRRGQAGPEPSEGVGDTAPGTPPAARYPRSMAAPGRDGELRRTFAPLPTPTSGTADGFAGTWWGNAWVAALEKGALDAARLTRGRAYADRGNVDAITVTPGLVLAYVQGSRPRPYRVQVRLRTFADEEWDRFLDAAAEQPGHIAALLDKQVPHSLAECGVRLLPGPGDLEPHCNCPDAGHPCKHAAAVCYQTARLLDRDPFVLFLLRGRGERELIDALSRRNAARAARAAREQRPASLPGVRARDVVAHGARPPLPAPLPPLAHPEQPPVYPAAPGGPDPFALDQLATDAAARAHALLTTGDDPVGELTLWQDAVRLAAARPGSGLTATTRPLYSALAAATGRAPADLARAVAAWRQGGREALAVLEEPWDPPAGRFDRARPQLLAADLPAFRPWRNRLTHPDGHAQLRLGRDGLWYAYESEPGQEDWWPRGTPDPDPVGALTGLGTTDER
ncbi:SWIM zinc finger family protein [Streptomyces glomeratus]|uniref:SWIM zinc finger family protein n=1 Tax=Streptomyces glomeratus TaxID=284452 RepID=UPI001F22232A|nr:SWIM zinc finger family protein [Streptomyces glomeratus]MCF1510514.1 SWIM zinc finger family protein [Streptomyces glomeratus]